MKKLVTVLFHLVFIICICPETFGQVKIDTASQAFLTIILTNSPEQVLLVKFVGKDGNYHHIDSIKLGHEKDSVHMVIPVDKDHKEQQLSLFFRKRGPGFIIPVLQPGDNLIIRSDLALPGIINHTSFQGSNRTLELYNYLKDGNDLSKIYLGRKQEYLNAVVKNEADTAKLRLEVDSLDKNRITFEIQEALRTQSPAILSFAIDGSEVYNYTFSKYEIAIFKSRFYYDDRLMKDLDDYIKRTADKPKTTHVPDFTLPDVKGKKISLSQFKGKTVLVDFWASWCVPCRGEAPNLKKAFEKFKKDNFIILSVSIDKDPDKWKKAIEQDNTQDFINLIDNNGWQAETVKANNITEIPMNFLIGPDGSVIAEDLRGDELSAKLTQLFDKH